MILRKLSVTVTLLLGLLAVPGLALVPGFGASDDISLFMSSKDNNNYLMNNIKAWMSLDFSDRFQVYLRGKFQHARLVNAASETAASDKSQSVIDLDQGYLAYRAGDFDVTAGRAVYSFGSGIVFDGTADGISARLEAGPFDVQLFGAYTGLLVKDSNPYNFSRQDLSDGAKRLFGGLQFRVDFGSGWHVALGGLSQSDRGSVEALRYDTQYASVELGGNFSPSVSLSLEGIYQGGEGPESTGTALCDIEAYAVVMRLQFSLLDNAESAFIFDAAYATGSDNRYEYAPGGINGTGKDSQFFAFGIYSTGFAFEPDLSNLVFGALSFTTMPFGDTSMFGRSTFNLRGSVYFKADKAGPTSEIATIDPLNDGSSAFLGWAADCNWSWRLVSDLSLVIGFGVFKPGTAYTTRDLETLVQTTLILAF